MQTENVLNGKILEEELNEIRKSPNPSDESIKEYLDKYKKYYEFNIYQNKTNDSVNSSTYQNYNTPKNYLLNFDSKELKINMNLHSKYAGIFDKYIEFKTSVLTFLENSNSPNLNLCMTKFNNYYNQINDHTGGGCVNKINQDLIKDNYFNYINLKTGNIAKKRTQPLNKDYSSMETKSESCDISGIKINLILSFN